MRMSPKRLHLVTAPSHLGVYGIRTAVGRPDRIRRISPWGYNVPSGTPFYGARFIHGHYFVARTMP